MCLLNSATKLGPNVFITASSAAFLSWDRVPLLAAQSLLEDRCGRGLPLRGFLDLCGDRDQCLGLLRRAGRGLRLLGRDGRYRPGLLERERE